MILNSAIGLLCLCLLSPHAPTGSFSKPSLVVQGKKSSRRVLLNYEAAKLIDVVKSISKLTGKNFIVEDSVQHKKLTIISGSRVTVDEAYLAFLDTLETEGLQIKAAGKFFKIINMEVSGPAREASQDRHQFGGISQIDEDTWEISQQAQKNILNGFHRLAKQARIVPSFKNGKTNGFKLFAILPGSLYTKLGIKNGDIIQRINEHEMSSPKQALKVYEKLRDEKTVVIEISRRGTLRKLTYKLK